jgi:hypothetical protein
MDYRLEKKGVKVPGLIVPSSALVSPLLSLLDNTLLLRLIQDAVIILKP